MQDETAKLISVIIPTHNRVDLLGNAIQSVVKQTYKNIEIIVVDDASTCNNQELIKNIDYPVVYHRFDTNQGGNVCRNKGVELSKGEYVAFLDDDDTWYPQKIEKQLKLMLKKNIDLCYTGKNIITVDEMLRELNRRYSFSSPKYDNFKKSIMYQNFLGTTSTILVDKNKFLYVGGFNIEMPALQDYEFYIRFIYANFSVEGVNESLVDYFIYKKKKSISKNIRKRRMALYKLISKNSKREFFIYSFYFIFRYIFKTISLR